MTELIWARQSAGHDIWRQGDAEPSFHISWRNTLLVDYLNHFLNSSSLNIDIFWTKKA
jgi:hypothetical protein